MLTVTAQETKAISYFDEIPQTYYDALKDEITDLGEELLARVKSGTPVGKTGQLQAGNHLQIKKGRDFIKAKVANYEGAKAIAIEYGATGRSHTDVRAHQVRLDHAWANAIAPRLADVPTFQRIQNIPAHPFMRPALASMQAEARDRIQAVTDRTTEAVNAKLNA